jgi:hypothetical protein
MRFFDDQTRARLIDRYSRRQQAAESVATVRDYCDSVDEIPQLTGRDGDLKNVQRPWMLKAVLGTVPPGSRLLEIGAGEPVVASALVDLGYEVTVVDPYDGSGQGPTEYAGFVAAFPDVRIVRARFGPDVPALGDERFSAIYSVSVLEHLPHHVLPQLFSAVGARLRPGGASIHCIDHVLDGNGAAHHLSGLRIALACQRAIAQGREPDRGCDETPADATDRLLDGATRDLETFYLSPQGHQLWRGGVAYDAFPFRKVISVQTIAVIPGQGS